MFIVVETHGSPEHAIIVTDEDGNNIVFDTYSEVENEANGCQAGIVVEL